MSQDTVERGASKRRRWRGWAVLAALIVVTLVVWSVSRRYAVNMDVTLPASIYAHLTVSDTMVGFGASHIGNAPPSHIRLHTTDLHEIWAEHEAQMQGMGALVVSQDPLLQFSQGPWYIVDVSNPLKWLTAPQSLSIYFRFPIWLPAWIAIGFVACGRLDRWIKQLRLKPGHCKACGYDLRGNESGICPECGEAVEASEA